MHHVAVLVLPGAVAFDVAVPSQVFGHPDEHGRYRLTVCGVRAGAASTTTGFTIGVRYGLQTLVKADTVVVAGFRPYDDPQADALRALRRAAARGARMVSICTGAFALAAAGLLDGRPATTHWRDAPCLAAWFPAVDVRPDELYVDDGDVLTSAGIAAGLDLCVHLVRRDHGESAATEVARRLVVAPHRAGGQAQYLHRPMPPKGTAGIAQTCDWAVGRLEQPLTVADLAREAGWAPRTFARRFQAETGTTPLRWLTARRLAEARRLLETTDIPVEAVAQRAGLGTAANLRALFTKDMATSPSAYRSAYRGRGFVSGRRGQPAVTP